MAMFTGTHIRKSSLKYLQVGWTSLLIESNIHYYRPPTKLREGNVLTGVCLSTEGRGTEVGVGFLGPQEWQDAPYVVPWVPPVYQIAPPYVSSSLP